MKKSKSFSSLNSFRRKLYFVFISLLAFLSFAFLGYGLNYYLFNSFSIPAWVYIVVGFLLMLFLILIGAYNLDLKKGSIHKRIVR